MRFWRAHGLGNDYLVLESGERLAPALVRALCDRHTGLGSDGILEPVPPREGAEHGLRIHNPDGSEAEKSGNGLRIYARWLVRGGAPPNFRVWTPGGVVEAWVEGDDVRIDMGPARTWGPEPLAGFPCFRVDIGNPHAVVLDAVADCRRRPESARFRMHAREASVVSAGLARLPLLRSLASVLVPCGRRAPSPP